MRAVALSLACALGGCSFHVDGLGTQETPELGVFLLDAGVPRVFDLASAPDLAQAPPPRDLAPPPDLSGAYLHVQGTATTAAINLTMEGTIDWAHWGYALAGDFDHKVSGNGLISNYTLIGALNALQYSDGLVSYKWNDGQGNFGQHPNSMGPSTTGIYIGAVNTGVRITAPASQTAQHLRFYVGGFKSTGQVQIQLGGGGLTYEDHSFGSANGTYNVVYDVEYRAASANQTLTLSWTMLSGDPFGNVTLQSATLLAP